MLLRVVTIISFGLALILTSCAPEHSQIVLATFGNNKITMGQFEKAYANNVGSYEQAKKDSLAKLKKFLNLYVDFRMKLRNAWVRGFDKDQELQDELQKYKKQVGVTYLLNKRIVDPGLDTLYNRTTCRFTASTTRSERPASGTSPVTNRSMDPVSR